MGGANGGHYTAFVKNTISGKWVHFNDIFCEDVNDEDTIVTESAYCLFYRMVQ